MAVRVFRTAAEADPYLNLLPCERGMSAKAIGI
jgi:hypothetical protein